MPLRGRAAVLTAGGTGLTGYGEVWAVHTAAAAMEISLMISYGPEGPADGRESGLCTAGGTVTLNKVEFTWRSPAPTPIPRPRAAGANVPRILSTPPPKTANTREDQPASGSTRLSQRLRNMVRVVTRSTRR